MPTGVNPPRAREVSRPAAPRTPRAKARNLAVAARPAAAVLALALALAPCPATADMSSGIVFDEEGFVYFADDFHETVWRLDPASGELEAFVDTVRCLHLAMDSAGNLYGEDIRFERAEDKWTSWLWRVDPDGNLTDVYGPKPGLPPGLLLDAEGNRYWNVRSVAPEPNSRIVKQTPTGELTTLAGSKWGLKDGEGEKVEVGAVYDMIWGPRERIYFTDSNAIRYLDPVGRVTTVTRFPHAEPTPALPEPTVLWGLTVDEEGTMHVAHYAERRVVRVWQAGGKKTVVQSEAPWFPTGVTTHDGKLYVLEHGIELPNQRVGPRVLEYDPKGVLRVLVQVEGRTAAN